MDWLVLWGVANVTTFAFTTVLTTLAQGALEDYVKDFFKACIHELVDLVKEKPLKVAFGQAVKEFLGLIQQELEDAELTQVEVEDYTESLTALMADKTAIETLGMPFQKALGKTADTDNQPFDVERVVQIWHRLNLKPLPDSFNWQRVAKRYGRKINYILRESDELRQRLDSETIAHLRQQLEQLTPISPDFELSRYQAGLIDAYDTLKLDTLDTRCCDYRLKLWHVFMPQNLREAENNQPELSVLNVLNQPQLYKYSVILGNPGSGKSTLLQYKALIWARNQPSVLPLLELPLLIELRNYVENRQKTLCKNFLDYLHHGTGVLGGTLNQKELDEWLRNRQTLVMFDGLDEIFDIQEQTNVVIDLINFTKTYPQARIVITSRILGYNQQRQRLRHAQFREFTLQDLDDEQIHSFIEQWHRLTYEDKRDGQKKTRSLTLFD